tara:strand:- start:524 stop:730 length:207 start_codon:yes stop_codon:yes gene_type:complete
MIDCGQCKLNDEEIKSLRASVVRSGATVTELQHMIEKIEGERDDARTNLSRLRVALDDILDKALDAIR